MPVCAIFASHRDSYEYEYRPVTRTSDRKNSCFHRRLDTETEDLALHQYLMDESVSPAQCSSLGAHNQNARGKHVLRGFRLGAVPFVQPLDSSMPPVPTSEIRF